MKTITMDIKDEYYEEFMSAIQEYIDKGLIIILNSNDSKIEVND